MDSTSSPQVDSTHSTDSGQASSPQTDFQTPIPDKAQSTVPPPDPVTTPVQEADSSVNVTQNSQMPSSVNSSKIITTLLIIIVITVMVAIGYFLMARMSGSSVQQTTETITPMVIEATVTPAPKNEQEEVDELDTTFPDSDMNSIQTDVQAL